MYNSTTEAVPSRVYDLDSLKSVARQFHITPTRPNIRRIRRAFDLLQKGNLNFVGKIEDARLYECQSQSRPTVLHLLVSSRIVECTCEDARKFVRRRKQTECKHGIAVRLLETETHKEAETAQEAA